MPVRALILEGVGGPERLRMGEMPDPAPGKGELLLRVRAVGINYADILIRQGKYPSQVGFPFVLGSEVGGEVIALGEGVTGFTPGDRVLALTLGGGGYAERARVPAAWTFRLPEGAGYDEGASFLMTYLTVWLPLKNQVRVNEGDWVLVHAAAGGVGSAGVRLARQMGARVVACVGSQAKMELCRELGAEAVLSYAQPGWGEQVRAATGGAGVAAVLDPVGGEIFAESLKLVRPLGAVAAIGYAAGAWPPIDPALLVGRNIGVVGVFLGRLMQRDPAFVQGGARDLLKLWTDGRIAPLVGHRYPLSEGSEAHQLIEDRRSVGKVVLEV